MRLRRVGHWRSDEHPEFPDPHDLVDETWGQEERDDVARYLESGVLFRAGGGLSRCRICGRPHGSAELTDFALAWPVGLAHYVQDHAVRLPPVVVAYLVRSRERVKDADVDDSWWATGAPEPFFVGEPPLDGIQRVAWGGNAQLLLDPRRRFPGLFIQGDTLSTHVDGARSSQLLRWYEEMMQGAGLALPYTR